MYPDFSGPPRALQKDTCAAKGSYTPAGFLFVSYPECALGAREKGKRTYLAALRGRPRGPAAGEGAPRSHSPPGPLEVSSQVLTSPRPVLPRPPGASPAAAGPHLPTCSVPAPSPAGARGTHRAFALLIRAVEMHNDIAFLDWIIPDGGSFQRLFYRQEPGRLDYAPKCIARAWL